MLWCKFHAVVLFLVDVMLSVVLTRQVMCVGEKRTKYAGSEKPLPTLIKEGCVNLVKGL
jgi:hypothetical protein